MDRCIACPQNILTALTSLQVLGFASNDHIQDITEQLRLLKVDTADASVPDSLEIVLTPRMNFGLYPGAVILFLSFNLIETKFYSVATIFCSGSHDSTCEESKSEQNRNDRHV